MTHTGAPRDRAPNPYRPGFNPVPQYLAGRDDVLDAAREALDVAALDARTPRPLVLVGSRGVGKTVLLGELRSMAVKRGWGAGKVEARPEADLRRPLSAALHRAIRDLAVRHRAPDRVEAILGVLKAFALRAAPDGAKLRDRWQPGIDVPAANGRADSGDIEIDLVELFTDVAELAQDVGTGVALLIDEMQDLKPDDISALCAACHELSQIGAPLVVVGAGLPHLPAVLSASKSYSERLFRYVRIDRLSREDADRAVLAPVEREDAGITDEALDALFDASGGYPYFIQAYGKAAWDSAPVDPISALDVSMAAPEADAELAVGFFGSRYERATPAEREYLRSMAELTDGKDAGVNTAQVADHLGRKPSSLSPARDSLIKKGLVYSAERGQIAFTVPHFGRFLLGRED